MRSSIFSQHFSGPEFNGKIATLAGLIFCLTVVLAYKRKVAAQR